MWPVLSFHDGMSPPDGLVEVVYSLIVASSENTPALATLARIAIISEDDNNGILDQWERVKS